LTGDEELEDEENNYNKKSGCIYNNREISLFGND